MAATSGTVLVDTCDVDAARVTVARSYCPHALSVRGDGTGFHARHTSAGGGGVGVHRLSYGRSAVVVDPEPFGDFVLVSRPVRGVFAVATRTSEVVVGAGRAVLLDPHADHQLRFGPDCQLLTVKLPRAAVDAAVADAGPAAPRRLRTTTATDPRPWDAVTRFLLTEAIGHGLLGGGGSLERHVVRLVAAAAVSSFAPPAGAPTGASGGDAASAPGAAPAAMRRALAFIDHHAGDDLSLQDIAAAGGCSPRALQEAFRRHLDTTPTAHLRARRLVGVRRELHEHPERSVAEVAHAWGFLHLGRFAAAYRREFGELPSRDRADGTSRAQRTGPGAAGS